MKEVNTINIIFIGDLAFDALLGAHTMPGRNISQMDNEAIKL